MIPGWEKTIELALQSLAPGGSLHIVDFGRQERLPRWFRGMLRAWLGKFHVSPRDDLHAELASQARVGRHEPRVRAALPRLCGACGGAQAGA